MVVKLGIIGAGRIGLVHAEGITNYIKGARVESIADPFITNEKKQILSKLGINSIVSDYKEILNNPEINAVLICSSTDTHASIITEAAKAGKNIFCEKPIDFDVNTIKETINLVQQAGVKFQVGFNRRFDHNFKTVKEWVRDGRIGDINVLKITSRDPSPPPIEYIKNSGGIFLDMMIHDFDMARYITDSEVAGVYAEGAVIIDKSIGDVGDVDTAIVTLRFANGALGVIDNSRKAVYGYDQRIEVFGSKGCLRIENDKPSTISLSTEVAVIEERPYWFFLERYTQSYIDEVKAFVESLRNHKEVLVTGNDGLISVVIAKAAKKSLEEKRFVDIKDMVM